MSNTGDNSAFAFEGTWREYAPIAFTNLLLAIVTLGLYRFWGKARTRRYLWSRTRFIDDRLEWTGTGVELFKGAIMALLLVGLPVLLINLLSQALVLRGQPVLGGLVLLGQFTVLFLLVGVALFRSLRYRLMRTYWRGIRGGSENPGLAYGWSYMWKNVVGYLAFGLLMPWAMVSLWNARWNAMSFGQHRFAADGRVSGLMGRYLLCYLAPILAVFALMVIGGIAAAGVAAGSASPNSSSLPMGMIGTAILAGIAGYLILGLVALAYYAKFFRQMVGGMSLHTLSFEFKATTKDWFKLLLGDFALVLVTLGIGSIFLDYRHWRFFIDHLEGYGEIDIDDLSQSTTAEVTQGEGLLDAFDMGAL